MTQMGNVADQVEGVRGHTIKVLDYLIDNAGKFELADPPPALERYRRKLRENAYKVLVVGEAKRGKSTFVNALIGQDILPTDVNVATSQVFNVRPSDREAYRLRYEDGSAREISFGELPLYGSQTMADAGFMPTSDQIIRWIEVDAPIKFLPENVSILDTPGLGALYASHARITHRFVPEADAVIFVLESGQPVVNDDLKFLDEILNVTRNVFFVQTKIDQFNQADWQNVLNRNQQILQERFGRRLADWRIWPVSSTNLRKAANAPGPAQDAYLMVSRHKELAAALQAFLARVAGWGRVAEAMATAVQYHTASRKALAGRLAGLAAESKQKQTELQKVAVAGKQQFDAEWGPQGQKYRELREGLQKAIAVGKQSFASVLQPGGDIEQAQKEKIDAVKSLADARQVANEMPDEVVSAAMNRWTQVTKEVQYRCVMLLGPFAEAAEGAATPVEPGVSGIETAGSGLEDKLKTDYFGMLRGAMGGGMLVTGISGMVGMSGVGGAAAGLTIGGVALTAVAPFVVVPALVALVGVGVKATLSGQVKQAQQQLKMQLHELLQKVRRHFFDVDLSAGTFSRVDEYFRDLDRTVNEQVREMAEKKSKESQVEISRLTQSMQLNERDRATRTQQAQQRLTQWDNLGKYAGQVMTRIKALQKPAAQPVPPQQGAVPRQQAAPWPTAPQQAPPPQAAPPPPPPPPAAPPGPPPLPPNAPPPPPPPPQFVP